MMNGRLDNSFDGYLDRTYGFDRFVFYFSLIDILFIPYASFSAISYSLFLLVPWLFSRAGVLKSEYKEFKLYIIFSVLVVISTFFGIVLHGAADTNIARGVQIIQILGYYFLFRRFLDHYPVKIKKYLLLFGIFVVALCLVYNSDKSLYVSFVQRWNPRGLSEAASLYSNLTWYRFCFIWMDPNNIAYMSVGIAAFLITNEETDLMTKIIILMGLVFVLISAMSSGGYISAMIETVIILVFTIFFRKDKALRQRRSSSTLKNFLTILMLPAIVVGIKRVWSSYSSSDIALESFTRFESNSADSRLAIWSRILHETNFLLYLVIGFGGVTYVGGRAQKPHNGHLYLILAFGLIAYVIFMYIVFRKRRETPIYNYIWIIPVFLGFTANILVGEVKLSAIIMLMVACSSSPYYLKERGHIPQEITYDE